MLRKEQGAVVDVPITAPVARARPARKEREVPCAPLSARKAGDAVRIVSVGGSAGLKRRLRDLGLRPGKAIEVCQHSPAGVIVSAEGLRLALAPEAAREILVEPGPARAEAER